MYNYSVRAAHQRTITSVIRLKIKWTDYVQTPFLLFCCCATRPSCRLPWWNVISGLQVHCLWSYAVNEGVIIRTENLVKEKVGNGKMGNLLTCCSPPQKCHISADLLQVVHSCPIKSECVAPSSHFTVLLVHFLIVMASIIQRWYLLPLDLITVALSHSMVFFSLS